jgi:ABC-type cobalamin transport system permease subunit
MHTIELPRDFAVALVGAILMLAAALLDALLILKPKADLALAPSGVERDTLLVSPFTMQVGTALQGQGSSEGVVHG